MQVFAAFRIFDTEERLCRRDWRGHRRCQLFPLEELKIVQNILV